MSMDDPADQEAGTGKLGKTGTRIYVSPHHVPSTPSPDRNDKNNTSTLSQNAVFNRSLESSFEPDVSVSELHASKNDFSNYVGGGGRVSKAYTYDAEENCLISETGVESDYGKIHYPLSWNKAGLESSRGLGSPSREIMVTRPFRTPETAASSSRSSPSPNRSTSSRVPLLAAYSRTSTHSSDKWGSETVNFSTGNRERDEVMNRARAILHAHDLQEMLAERRHHVSLPSGDDDDQSDGVDGGGEEEKHYGGENSRSRPESTKRTLVEQELLEDGVAPLGGDWPRRHLSDVRKVSRQQMLGDPMNHLHEIHDHATQKLNVSTGLALCCAFPWCPVHRIEKDRFGY